jgi:signal transduction histidine kinase
MGRDVTERRILESQLAQAQKLESIGQLAAGIAHEINTPTQYVGDNVRFLQDAFTDVLKLVAAYGDALAAVRETVPEALAERLEAAGDEADTDFLAEEVPRAIAEALEGVKRVATIVQAMKEFSHPGTKEKELIDLNRAIETTVTISRNEWKYVAEMETDFGAGLARVPCLPGEFNQVVLNLITNAAHAIGDVVAKDGDTKGKIAVRTRCVDGRAEVRIEDTGPGIPAAIRDRIFDPFFTTKAVGKGTGQGLAIARSVIVDKHGGAITVESRPGEGTTFVIQLPLEVEEEPSPAAGKV